MIDTPPVWLLGFAVLVWILDAALDWGVGSGLLVAVGTGLVLLGCVLVGLAAWQFRRHQTTIIPHLTASNLIRSGVFAWSRNPIYLADAIILAGLCLRWDFLPSLLLVPVFMTLIQRRFILGEEDRLRTAFGAEFDDYAQKTRRWI
ncbi:MAG: isoprenylcysteine carboxylmethyltransferase family protein [Pseudomonadota bacterium]